MNRHEIEQAVAYADQVIHAFRGIEGLVGVCKTALNATKMVDGLEEKKALLEADIQKLEKERLVKQSRDEKVFQKEFEDHSQRIATLQRDHKLLQDSYAALEVKHQERQYQLDQEYTSAMREHASWMEDCRQKELIANENLVSIKAQYEQIRARFA